MNILVHYQTEKGIQQYTLTGKTKEELDIQLNKFKEINNLTDEQITLQVISTNI